MRVYETKLKQFFNVETKEELTPTMVLVTKVEEDNIHRSLENYGEVWVDERGNIAFSGPRPIEYKEFDLETKTWKDNEELKQSYLTKVREEVWERIKEKRSQSIETGVFHPKLNKWFHTDVEAQRNYALLGHAVNSPLYQPKHWKTMDGTFTEMTREVFQDVLALALKKADEDYRNAEIHKAKLMLSENPLAYDFSTGWSLGYTNDKG